MGERCSIYRVPGTGWRCATHNTTWDDGDEMPPSCKAEPDVVAIDQPIKVTFDDNVYSPEPGTLVKSVHYATDPKTGKRRVIIEFG